MSLCSLLRTIIESLPGRPHRPLHVARSIGANQNLAHRLCTAIAKEDPLEALLAMPGAIPLTQFVDLAEAHGVASEVCEAARRAVREFEELALSVGNDRTTFDAVLSEWVPSARAKIDTTARQSVFRGLRQVRGASSEVYYFSALLHPSAEDNSRLDVLILTGNIGIERIRNNGRLVLSQEVHLTGEASGADSSFRVLEEYGAGPNPKFTQVEAGSATRYSLEWDDAFGKASRQDVALACLHRGGFVRSRSGKGSSLGAITARPEVPARRMVFDLLLHRGVFPGYTPYFRIYALKWSGINNPNDPADDLNIIPQDVEVQSVHEGGVADLITPGVTFYQKMVDAECSRARWDISGFRMFRVCVDYPLMDADSQFVIALPDPAEGGS